MLTAETFAGIRKAFAMLAIAMLAGKTREFISQELPPGITIEPIDGQERNAELQKCVVNGDVTTIVSNPQPFTWIYYRGTFGEVRAPYGLWIGRQASWRGKRSAPTQHALQPFDEGDDR